MFKCIDIDECALQELGSDICPENTICRNTDGGYVCEELVVASRAKQLKFQSQPITPEIPEIDYCENDPCGDHGICTSLPDIETFNCECQAGYVYHQLFKCTDIDECEVSKLSQKNLCPNNQTCVNTDGSFYCLDNNLPKAQALDVKFEINYCKNDPCGNHGICTNLPKIGSFECDCEAGYFYHNLFKCMDIDECAINDLKVGGGVCQDNEICRNLDGGYECVAVTDYCENKPCGNHGICKNLPEIESFDCECEPGYLYHNLFKCQDIDECELANLSQNSICSDYQTCVNTDGGYRCEDKNYCPEDVIQECGATGICINQPELESFVCECQNGYYFHDLLKCIDLNECEYADDLCEEDEVCHNLDGGYRCEKQALELKMAVPKSTFLAKDVRAAHAEKVAVASDSRNDNLSETEEPECPSGYISHPLFNCIDLDECIVDNICDANSFCENTDGGFICTCNSGFVRDEDKNCVPERKAIRRTSPEFSRRAQSMAEENPVEVPEIDQLEEENQLATEIIDEFNQMFETFESKFEAKLKEIESQISTSQDTSKPGSNNSPTEEVRNLMNTMEENNFDTWTKVRNFIDKYYPSSSNNLLRKSRA